MVDSRRAKITPEQAGLHSYNRNRRVPGLRRSEVADKYGGVLRRARMPPIRPARSTVDLTTCVGSSHVTDLVAGTPRAVNGRSCHGGAVLFGT